MRPSNTSGSLLSKARANNIKANNLPKRMLWAAGRSTVFALVLEMLLGGVTLQQVAVWFNPRAERSFRHLKDTSTSGKAMEERRHRVDFEYASMEVVDWLVHPSRWDPSAYETVGK